MRKGIIIGVAGIILIGTGVLAVRFFSGEDNWICQNGEWVKHGNPSAEKPTTDCGQSVTIQNDEQKAVEEANIIVFDPKENARISSPFDVEGKARVFENVVSIKLTDKGGKILFQGVTDAKSPDVGQFGLFQEEITFKTNQTEGTLEVFEASAKDGSEINKVSIPVKFVQNANEEEN